MRLRTVLAVALLASTSAGCKQLFGLDEPLRADAGIDVAIDTPPPDARACFGAGLLSECVPDDAAQLLVLSTNIDTMTDPRCASASTEYCVIRAHVLEVPVQANVIATGPRPLVLVARDAIRIDGYLDVSSRRVQMGFGFIEQVGAGSADAALCTGASPGTANAAGGGGGAGGSFGGEGGNGGIGDNGNGGASGLPGSAVPLLAVRGGCRGTRGGGAGSAMGAGGGAGGGVAYLIAGASITITGTIHAGGMGGYGGDVEAGGGGGGSGGLIVLDAPTVTNAGVLTANGGGGGEGGGNSNTGASGGSAIDPTQPAGGGANIAGGGNGGTGSFGMTLRGGNGGVADQAGGGGGGGAGIIRTYPSQALSGLVSPPAM